MWWAYTRGGSYSGGGLIVGGLRYINYQNVLLSIKPGAHTAILVGRFKFRCMILANLAM